jgi:uncharacterized membrane protein
MVFSAILLGLINIAIVVALLSVIGAIAEWTLDGLGFRVSLNVHKMFFVIVALAALYMLVALMFDIPTVRIISSRRL